MTSDLQALAKDGHLRLAPRAPGTPAPARRRHSGERARLGPPGLEDARMIGDVAYLRFNQFVDEPPEPEKARAFLLAHADAKAVIIDARPHRGGGLAVMDAILPLLYAKTTHLVRMDTRAGIEDSGPLTDGPTLVRQASRRPWSATTTS
uniref:Tail specific protease domain-containing protein n=1 Tax=Phenylobacterium glaciei TaxID=2803784 RepID=A0A974P268_9CAUL|nr:hypothetical protein JKL49_21830 [Phenylobacterium glaciei]